jgi:NTE family protein
VFFELGIYKGDYVHSWLAEQIKSLNVETFADLHEDDPGSSLPPDQRYKLVVMASDVSGGRLLRLPWDYEHFHRDPGTQRVADAVRASISIPFFYRPVRLRDLHGGAMSTLVDGGMLSNFPVDTFDRTDGKPPRWPTIGIKLSARPDANQVPRQVTNDWQLIECMLGTMMNFHDQMYLDKPEVQRRTIFVDTMKVSATDFSIDPQTQDQLYENGRAAAEKFLAQRRPGAQ